MKQIALAVLMMVFSCQYGYASDKPSDQEIKNLATQLAMIETSPCNTNLLFFKFPITNDWFVTCNGCSGVSANRFFPRMVLDKLDKYVVGTEITMTQYLRYEGLCR